MANPYGPPLSNVESGSQGGAVAPSLVTVTHLIYGLHALSIIVGIVGTAFIVGSFLLSIPSIIAIILNYVKRSEVRGTYLESHFRWQIRTFWFAAMWAVIGALVWVLLAIVIIGFLIGPAILIGTGIWVTYRVVRGWLALRDGQPISS